MLLLCLIFPAENFVTVSKLEAASSFLCSLMCDHVVHTSAQAYRLCSA